MKKTSLKNLMLVSGIILGCAVVSHAQVNIEENTVKIDLPTAIQKALQSSEDLLISQNNIQKSEAEYKREKSAIYPQVNGVASASHYFEYPEAAAAVNDYAADVGVSVNQLLWSFGKVRAAINAQDKYMDVSRLNAEATRQAVIYNTKVSYFSVLLADHSYEVLKQSLRNAQDNKDILEERSASGRVSRRDSIKASADVAARQPLVNDAEKIRHTAYQDFKVVTGIDSSLNVSLTDTLDKDQYEEINDSKMFEAMDSNEPMLKALARTIELRKDFVQVKKASFFPEISGFAGWNHKGVSDDLDLNSPYFDDYGVVGVTVSVPFWTGGFLTNDLQVARIDQKNAELDLRKARENYTLAMDQALASYRDLIKTLEANNEAVRLSKESFTLTQDFFKTGSATLTDLNDAELQLTQQRLNREQTLYNICVTLAKIEQLTVMENLP